MNIVIEKATQADFDAVQKFTEKLNIDIADKYDHTVNKQFVYTDNGKKYIEKVLNNDDSVVFIAKTEGKAVGYILATIEKIGDFRTIHSKSEIDFLWVDEGYRGNGIGSMLMQSIQTWSKEKGVDQITLYVDHSNIDAVTLYKKEGFIISELLMIKHIQ